MTYGPHTPADRAQMLGTVGVDDIDALFEAIPPAIRTRGVDLPPPIVEHDLARRLEQLAARNHTTATCFLGAGAYRHWIPPVVDQLLLRGEFSTAYTPYQPEISQGTLQVIYEYQSLIAALTGLDVVSASHYDGATATAEAALMAVRATGRARVLVSRGLHPHYRQVLATYLAGRFALDEIDVAMDGTTDVDALGDLTATHAGDTAAVILEQPNFLGCLEDMAAAAVLAHDVGALFVAVTEPVALAVLAPPGSYRADIAVGEGQPLGIPLQFGGPYLGLLACTETLTRHITGRLVGATTDANGRRGYVMTLRAREQDIRREKAASNICTNQALCALAATIYLSAMGPDGLTNVAASGAARARELESALAEVGVRRVHRAAYLNEFAVTVPNAAATHAALAARGIIAGLPLHAYYPDDPLLTDALLVCATETTTSDDIDRLAKALTEMAS